MQSTGRIVRLMPDPSRVRLYKMNLRFLLKGTCDSVFKSRNVVKSLADTALKSGNPRTGQQQVDLAELDIDIYDSVGDGEFSLCNHRLRQTSGLTDTERTMPDTRRPTKADFLQALTQIHIPGNPLFVNARTALPCGVIDESVVIYMDNRLQDEEDISELFWERLSRKQITHRKVAARDDEPESEEEKSNQKKTRMWIWKTNEEMKHKRC